MTTESRERHSDVAYVVAKLRVRGEDYVLLRAHPKWGDWSLVGGHVEPLDASWLAAAAREVDEEMAPLRCGRDVDVQSLDVPGTQWGPVPSRSAGNRPTRYRAEWYQLLFKLDPREALGQLPPGAFRMVRLADLERVPGVSSIVQRAAALLPGGWRALPLSWQDDLDDVPVERMTVTHAPAPPANVVG